ncbi:hypothetical protein GCM10010519_16440 [Streptomyces lactacystinicus]
MSSRHLGRFRQFDASAHVIGRRHALRIVRTPGRTPTTDVRAHVRARVRAPVTPAPRRRGGGG